MTTKTTTAPEAAKPDLSAHYQPLGLKAVLAASMMIKRPPQRKTA